MSEEQLVGPVDDLPPGKVTGVGQYAVGDADGEMFAVSRRCRRDRHLDGVRTGLARGRCPRDRRASDRRASDRRRYDRRSGGRTRGGGCRRDTRGR